LHCCGEKKNVKRAGETGDRRLILITRDIDVVTARDTARQLGRALGFNETDLVCLASAVSEVARNILTHARQGQVELSVALPKFTDKAGIQVVARDQGPGIADISLVMNDGFSTAKSLGVGLPGSRRLMDEFDLQSKVGNGTVVTMRKWPS
jgi:serine/threonine-protein kinase RsbT